MFVYELSDNGFESRCSHLNIFLVFFLDICACISKVNNKYLSSYLVTEIEKDQYWIEILLKYQLSCVINNGITIQYFNLERGNRQDDQIFAYFSY